VLHLLENAARNNEEIHKLSTEYKSRTQTLAGELNRVKKTCADQVIIKYN